MQGYTITYAEFHGLTRLSLHRIKRIALRLDGGIMIFLGKNGSGKSSLVKSLTPLPADKTQYTKDGKKLVHIDGGRYVLTSDFSKKQVHSFIFDGVELNQGGTITVQNELVKTHFGITDKTLDLIYGDETFHSMLPAKRKEWFLRISNDDYAYALDVYNRVMEKNRDANGALKLAKKALATELDKVTSDTELQVLEEKIAGLEQTLTNLLELRKPLDKPTEHIELDIENNSAKLSKYNAELLGLLKTPIERLKTREEYQSTITTITTQLEALNQTRRSLLERHQEASRKTELARANTGTIESLQQELYILNEEKRVELTKRPNIVNYLTHEHEDLQYMLASWESIRGELTTIFEEIPSNSDGRYSQSELVAYKELEATQMTSIERTRNVISKLHGEITHMEEHRDKQDAVCPKCNHEFSTKFSEDKLKQKRSEVDKLSSYLETSLLPALEVSKTYIKECTLYADRYRAYHRLTTSNKKLSPIWDYIASEEVLRKSPREGVDLISHIARLLTTLNKVRLLDVDIKGVNEKLSIAIQAKDLNITQELAIKLNLEEELERLSDRRTKLMDNLSITKQEMVTGDKIREVYARMMECYNQGPKLHQELIENYRRETLLNLHRTIQKQLATHTLEASKIKAQKAAIQIHTKNVELYTKVAQDTSTLLKVLSPTTGLIAEGMLGFINMFIETVNDYLGHIWSYPLEVQKYAFSEGVIPSINYLFPVTVGVTSEKRNDISEGSVGMKEVFNLAFRLSTMEYMGLRNTPLYLDEVGANFDQEHKSTLSGVLREIADQQLFSQIFLVSHNSEFHAGLANVEYCCLSEDTQGLPGVNRMVEIDRY